MYAVRVKNPPDRDMYRYDSLKYPNLSSYPPVPTINPFRMGIRHIDKASIPPIVP